MPKVCYDNDDVCKTCIVLQTRTLTCSPLIDTLSFSNVRSSLRADFIPPDYLARLNAARSVAGRVISPFNQRLNDVLLNMSYPLQGLIGISTGVPTAHIISSTQAIRSLIPRPASMRQIKPPLFSGLMLRVRLMNPTV